ncbi:MULTISPECIES: anthranilate phosphoribosyltransferase [Myroides]|uniref:Anthranilate phosphoribosyltransferase n=1 Tax=Myroides albus TaxID=2562892 RepID=A0A6I3LJP7_9FLAO|nr:MULTISPECIES: anthranilate phosphoribosyltransferase [Myroides]MTG96701.1 anthranilate phosphoribosyltransferase [Myroides albus]MVX34713.1 anthranilate phosphoribosyltransferase [Myroides sp. LoEW2-1]UVD80887.1 anthranilate phosphoribosyltransferase [Myroides albus]
MKEILNQLTHHKTLSKAQAKEVLYNMVNRAYSDMQLAALLTTFLMRPITLEELKGFREAMVELAIKVNLSEFNPMDMCGTGGDGKDTFNISTLASFVVAGAGIPVAKHGNYGVSSISGSSSVMENLGIHFKSSEEDLKKQLKEANICFLHAPLFHPAMKEIAPIRKALGVKTFFNMLGPLTNPAQPKVQLIGLFNLELLRMYQYFLQQEQTQYSIVHSLDGYDECSLTSQCKIATNTGERIIDASHFDLSAIKQHDIKGGNTVEESALIFWTILKGKGTTQQSNVVLANAALAIQTYYPKLTITEAMERAKDSLFTGKAKQSFEILRQL